MRIVIADDAVLLRAGLERLLTDAGHEVVAAVGRACSPPYPTTAPTSR